MVCDGRIGGSGVNIGGKIYSKTKLPSDFKLQDVSNKKMQRKFELFDVNGDGNISQDEASKISLFYKTGKATFSNKEGGVTTDYTISASKRGIQTRTDVIDKNDNLLSTDITQYGRDMEMIKADQYRYEHKSYGNVKVTHDYINSKDELVKTEESTIDKDGHHLIDTTFNYSRDKNNPNQVNVKRTQYGGTETYNYKSW